MIEQRIHQFRSLYTPIAIIISAFILANGLEFRMSGENLAASAGQNQLQNQQQEPKRADLTVTESDQVRGSADAPITIVEFSDFECPYCQRFHPTVKKVFEEYDGKIRWVYRHFPLTSIHPNAQPAAEAAECVGEQKGDEGFWKFGDALFEHQKELGIDLYRKLAGEQGVDMNKFNACVASRKYKEKVESNQKEGVGLGITGTPNSYINGISALGALPYEELKAIIEKELQEKK